VAWLAKTVLTEEDKGNLKAVTLELAKIRRLIDELAETLVNLSDKQLLRMLSASQAGIEENQVDRIKLSLEKQVDVADREFQT
jgi:hypothetical protein